MPIARNPSTTPTTVMLDVGQASAGFQITLHDDAIADGTQQVDITASGSSYISRNAVLDVWDDEPAEQQLVAYWALDELTGSTAADRPLLLVDDCALSGTRFRRALTTAPTSAFPVSPSDQSFAQGQLPIEAASNLTDN